MKKHALRFSLAAGLSLFALAAAHAADDTNTLPRLPFPRPAAEYPQEALVANQEGSLTLRATIGTDAKMTNVSVVESSGHAILDDAAVLVLRNAQLSQAPMTPDGTPTTADILVDATWDLPLESAEEYFPEEFFGPAPHVPSAAITYPVPDRSNPPAIRARDYPPLSIRFSESGAAGLYILVNERGRIDDARIVSSSGHERLDEASINVSKRFNYIPGTIENVPTAFWMPLRMTWMVVGGSGGTRSLSLCYGMAIVDPYRRRESQQDDGAPPLDRWILYNRDGVAEASLILTDTGLRKLAPPLLEALNAQPGPIMDDNRPEACWIYDGPTADEDVKITGTLISN